MSCVGLTVGGVTKKLDNGLITGGLLVHNPRIESSMWTGKGWISLKISQLISNAVLRRNDIVLSIWGNNDANSLTPRISSSCIMNTMVSAAISLNLFSRNIPVSTPEALRLIRNLWTPFYLLTHLVEGWSQDLKLGVAQMDWKSYRMHICLKHDIFEIRFFYYNIVYLKPHNTIFK